MFDIFQTNNSIYSKLRIFTLFWSHTWKYNIQAEERLTKVKEKWSTIQFDIFDLSFIFYIPMSQTISAINRSVASVLVSVGAIACIKWIRLNLTLYGKNVCNNFQITYTVLSSTSSNICNHTSGNGWVIPL